MYLYDSWLYLYYSCPLTLPNYFFCRTTFSFASCGGGGGVVVMFLALHSCGSLLIFMYDYLTYFHISWMIIWCYLSIALCVVCKHHTQRRAAAVSGLYLRTPTHLLYYGVIFSYASRTCYDVAQFYLDQSLVLGLWCTLEHRNCTWDSVCKEITICGNFFASRWTKTILRTWGRKEIVSAKRLKLFK